MNIKPFEIESLDTFLNHYEKTLNESGVTPMPLFNLYEPGEFKINDQVREAFSNRFSRSLGEVSWEKIFVCWDDDEIIGHALLRGHRNKFRLHRSTLMMGVEAEHISKGLGTKLLRSIIDWAEKQNTIEYIDLSVFSVNIPAIKLYKKFNFTEKCTVRDAYRIDRKVIDEVFMELKIIGTCSISG